MNVNDPRWASIDAFVEENRDNILRDITRLVAVPSVEGAPEPGAPFGPGPKAALAKALEIADELGLDTFNADSYIGWAETGRIADGQKFLATITTPTLCPRATAGTPTPTRSACGTAGCWAAAWPTTKAQASSACTR